MPGEPPITPAYNKSSNKVKRISIPRVQGSPDTELTSSQQSCSIQLQPTTAVPQCVTFRTDIEESTIPPAIRSKLLDLFQQIEKEFEMLCAENTSLQEKIEALNEKLVRDGTGERNITINDFHEFTDVKTFVKSKSLTENHVHKIKASHKLKAQTSKIVSSFKNPTMTCSVQREYQGHRDGVWEVCICKSGQPIIATASADHTARIWGIDSCRCLLQYMGHSGSVNSVRFHPNKELVLSASGDCSAHVWQAAVNWELPKRPSIEDVLAISGERSTGINAGGDSCVVQEEETAPILRTPVKELLGHTGVVIAADWLYGADQIVTASWDRTANLYDAESGEIIHTLCGHDQELTNVSTHHAQRLCVTSSRDSTFRLWDFREPIHSVSVFQGHTETVTSAVFTREDKIVSASDDRSVKVWELRNIRSPLATIRADSSANKLAVSSSGIIAIPHDNRQIRLFDVNGQRLARLPRTSRQGHRRMVCSVTWAEDNNLCCNLFSCGIDRLVLGWSILAIKDA